MFARVRRAASSRSRNNLNNQTATLEMPFWLFMGPLVVGSLLLVRGDRCDVRAHAAAPPARRQAHGADLKGDAWTASSSSSRSSRCSCSASRSCWRSAFRASSTCSLNGLPIDLIAQRTLYALDSFPLVAVPVFLFVGSLMNSAGISRYIYKFADTAVGPPAGRARAGEHLRQPGLRRHVGLGAGRHRRHRPHRDRRDEVARASRRRSPPRSPARRRSSGRSSRRRSR